MNFKKRVNGSWTDTPHYIHNTATDTITTLPADIYADGNNATVGISGNTVQSGTPTPDNPIMPQGCGVRTENLFDISTWHGVTATRGNVEEVENGFKITATSNDAYTNTYGSGTPQCSYKVVSGENYTLSWNVDKTNIYGVVYVFSGETVGDNVLTNVAAAQQKVSFTVPSGHNYITFRLGVSSSGDSITYTNIMLNLGSTAKPYEPYGYKIPISSANTTTPVYLGEVESTRRIKKLVLTGEEDITFASEDNNRVVGLFNIPNMGMNPNKTGYCNILLWKSEYSQSDYNRIVSYASTRFYMSIEKTMLPTPTIEGFISYLQQQYAAGTPVTIWYVLATPKTATINEPLMKIGNYADTVNNITIPVTAGGDTLSVDTTVQPSGVAINYKGWHNAKCKEYSYNMTIADWESASISQMENHTIQELQGGNWV